MFRPLALAFSCLLAFALPATGMPEVPPGFTLEVVTAQLPDSDLALAIAGPDFGAFGGQHFVASYTQGKVWRIDPAGIPHEFASGFVLPASLRFGPGGMWGTDLYVSQNSSSQNPEHGRIQRVDAGGGVTDLGDPTPATMLYGGGGLAFSESGAYGQAVYVGISAGLPGDGIARFTPPGGSTLFALFAGVPTQGYAGFVAQMDFGPGTGGWTDELHLMLSDQNGVGSGLAAGGLYRVGPAGAITPIVTADADARLRRANGLAFGPGGAWGRTIYGGTAEGVVLAIDPDGTVTEFATGLARPSYAATPAVAFDAQGRLCFVEPGTATLWRVAPATAGVPAPRTATAALSIAPSVTRGTATITFALPQGVAGRLEVFDTGGRRLRARTLAPGERGSEVWDGRDADGRAAPGGLYFASLTAAGERRVARVVRLR